MSGSRAVVLGRGGCRACGSNALSEVLDLGKMPAADHFPERDEPFETDPLHALAMVVCHSCGLAQLAEDDTVTDEPRGVEPRALREQAADAVARIAATGLLRGRTVREFGSPHGGTWLPLLAAHGCLETPGAPADVVVDSFGLMHCPDQRAAALERAGAVRADGVLLLQFHSLRAILAQGQWNALRHGHFAYYTLTTLCALFAGVGMRPATAWEFDLYGGTVLVAFVHRPVAPDRRVRAILDAETGLDDPALLATLQTAADEQAEALRRWLDEEAAHHRRVYAYGAASRAVALFARAGLRRDRLAGVADASLAKQGRRMPGTDIPIVCPAALVAAQPDRVLLTLPDLVHEVAAQLPSLRGRWVVDIPRPP
ncbi:class I SAM-dependent methyltransferase [Nocardia sp. CDC159]|uniref:Class I SAM-dependent methyltransferase n=1 Tax=Nocardia pulmonis TaxID=2951408 RepID=A0A9X2E0Z5_9NOCA|nr:MULTISPECIES: class I SAM-dependent methyltransferase [Nocardia]MCM6772182.1 class I SAM-dependent methyltransferase [Nocardia pulmonis]MCM6785160.1 class I SAM-dependent methyltransferase [Nocardia sp. CDC159]